MSETAAIAILGVTIFESLVIFLGNIFTIVVFWIHRHKLKRTSFLLINLAVADLLVGFTQTVAVGLYALPRHIGHLSGIEINHGFNILSPFLDAFLGTSMLFLVLISLERAFALIWPLRHRVTSTTTYIYSIVFAWLVGITLGVPGLLSALDLYDRSYNVVFYSIGVVFSLVTICVSYLAIRTRLNNGCPAIDTAHNRQSVEKNTKLSKTLFIVIGASVILQVPSMAVYCTKYLFPGFLPDFVIYIFIMLYFANSLVNPIIYSLRMPVFRESLKRLKHKLRIRKKFKRYSFNEKV